MAGQQRRLGAVPRPVLGHAAAGVAVRRGARPLRGLAGRAVRAGRARRRPTSTPTARTSTRSPSPVPTARRATATGWPDGDRCAGWSRSSTPGSTRGRCPPAQWGYPLAEGSAEHVRLPGRLHLRGHRPDPGLVLLAAGRQHPGAGRDALPQRALPRPHRRRRRPQDVQEPGQRHRPLGDPRHPGRRPAAVVDVLAGIAVDADPGQLRGHRRRHAGHPADPVEHLVVLHHLRLAQRVRPRRPGHPGPPDRRSVLDRWMRSRLARHGGGRHRGPRRLRAVPGRHRHRRAGRRHLQLVRAPQPPPVLADRSGRRPGRLARAPRPPCTRCW